MSYGEKFAELKRLTNSLEREDLSLEDAMSTYERAARLAQELRLELQTLEQRMTVTVLDTDGKPMQLPDKDRR